MRDSQRKHAEREALVSRCGERAIEVGAYQIDAHLRLVELRDEIGDPFDRGGAHREAWAQFHDRSNVVRTDTVSQPPSRDGLAGWCQVVLHLAAQDGHPDLAVCAGGTL